MASTASTLPVISCWIPAAVPRNEIAPVKNFASSGAWATTDFNDSIHIKRSQSLPIQLYRTILRFALSADAPATEVPQAHGKRQTCTKRWRVFLFPMKKHTNVGSPVTGKAFESTPNDIQAPASTPRWVAYYRVSTAKQGASGLGLEAQTEAVTHFVAGRGGEIVAAFTETESGKKASNRPELIAALALCRKRRATLVIAKLDRLARNVHFISGLLESNVLFVAADQPTKDRFMLHLQAAFAEEEGRRISLRTKEALDRKSTRL